MGEKIGGLEGMVTKIWGGVASVEPRQFVSNRAVHAMIALTTEAHTRGQMWGAQEGVDGFQDSEGKERY